MLRAFLGFHLGRKKNRFRNYMRGQAKAWEKKRYSISTPGSVLSTIRKFSKPETLFLPAAFKNLHQQVTRHTSPQKFLAYHMAKRRNKFISKHIEEPIRLKLKNSLTKSMVKLSNANFIDPKKEQEEFAKKVCRSRKVRRDEIMRKTAGKGLKIKKAVWTDISKMVKCEKRRK